LGTPPLALGTPGRPRGEDGRHTSYESFLLGPGPESPSEMFAGSESTARPHGPPDQQGLDGTQGAPHRPPAPNKRRMTDWHRVSCFPITGRGHKNQPMMNGHTSLQPTRIACRPFGGPARSQPAETIQTPLIRPHVPAVPTPPRQPHPASPWTCEQMEATGAPVEHR